MSWQALVAPVLGGLLVGLSFERLRRLGLDLGELKRTLALVRDGGGGAAEARDLERAAVPSSARELVDEFVAAPDQRERVLVLNEWIAQFEGLRERARSWPKVAARVALASGVGLAFVEFAAALGGQAERRSAGLLALAVGLLGAGGAVALGRKQRREVEGLRRELETLRQLCGAPRASERSRTGRRGGFAAGGLPR
ncbi:MAG TPA: hypothetical protein VLC09_00280 [Polyangiaceae bacterium]|nr:hypothetical protein [Polyangiaceae bacterium]